MVLVVRLTYSYNCCLYIIANWWVYFSLLFLISKVRPCFVLSCTHICHVMNTALLNLISCSQLHIMCVTNVHGIIYNPSIFVMRLVFLTSPIFPHACNWGYTEAFTPHMLGAALSERRLFMDHYTVRNSTHRKSTQVTLTQLPEQATLNMKSSQQLPKWVTVYSYLNG